MTSSLPFIIKVLTIHLIKFLSVYSFTLTHIPVGKASYLTRAQVSVNWTSLQGLKWYSVPVIQLVLIINK